MHKKRKITKTEKILFSIVFYLFGLLFIYVGIFPTKLEINPVQDNTIYAQITTRSQLPPFEILNRIVYNLKQAIITSKETRKYKRNYIKKIVYRVELEDFDGKITPITSFYSSKYDSKNKLREKINLAIKDKKHFECVLSNYSYIVFGILLILGGIIVALWKMPHKYNNNLPKEKDTNNAIQTENINYKDINDSIIK